MKLTGHNLHDNDLAGVAHLFRAEIESALARLGVDKIDLGSHLIRLQIANDAFRPAEADLRFRNRFRTDLKTGWNVLEYDGSAQGDFSGFLVGRNQPPQAGREKQRQHLQEEIVEDQTAQ